jgi:hypothetical protein|tara:strand:- start:3667 stop:3876 length:210 start_codon:yes stop_codon:yes gene_type:complete
MKDIEYIKVEGHSHLVRDDSSHGIVNTDIENFKLTMKRRELMKTTREEINTLKGDMDEIKSLLTKLIER